MRERAISPETEAAQKKKLAATPYAQDWQIDVVMKSLPFLTDKSTIRKTLEECKGSIDNAVSRLLDEDSGNQSSAQESSSIEREPDSDDDQMNQQPLDASKGLVYSRVQPSMRDSVSELSNRCNSEDGDDSTETLQDHNEQ